MTENEFKQCNCIRDKAIDFIKATEKDDGESMLLNVTTGITQMMPESKNYELSLCGLGLSMDIIKGKHGNFDKHKACILSAMNKLKCD